MGILTAEDILGTSDLSMKLVSVPEWNGDVMIKEMSVNIRAEFESRSLKYSGGTKKDAKSAYKEVIVWLVLQSVVDENGVRIFKNTDTESFMARNAKGVNRLYDEIIKHNAIQADAIEEDEKNLETAQSESSDSV